MYELSFSGITPDKLMNEISVVNNNKADILRMIVSIQQRDISLDGYNAYIKVQSRDLNYMNKEKLTVTSVDDKLHLDWTLTFDYTRYKDLQCQIQFQSDDDEEVVWQSAIFYIHLNSTIRVDNWISNNYPTELNQIETWLNSTNIRMDEIEVEIGELEPDTKLYKHTIFFGADEIRLITSQSEKILSSSTINELYQTGTHLVIYDDTEGEEATALSCRYDEHNKLGVRYYSGANQEITVKEFDTNADDDTVTAL